MSTPPAPNPKPDGSRRATILTIVVALGIAAVFFLNTNWLGVLVPDLVANPAEGLPLASQPAATPGSESPTQATKAPAVTVQSSVESSPESSAESSAPPTSAPQAPATMPAQVNGVPTIAYAALPVEAHETIALIDAGGPYPYDQDGSVFQNREGLLPGRPQGYYREYTVVTPGSDDRGARRMIQGAVGELYYTDDHYESFSYVVR